VSKFMTKPDADALLNFLAHYLCDIPNMHNQKFWLIAGNGAIKQKAIIHACAWRSKVTRSPFPAPSACLFKRKK
jgi:hypothetical protein